MTNVTIVESILTADIVAKSNHQHTHSRGLSLVRPYNMNEMDVNLDNFLKLISFISFSVPYSALVGYAGNSQAIGIKHFPIIHKIYANFPPFWSLTKILNNHSWINLSAQGASNLHTVASCWLIFTGIFQL